MNFQFILGLLMNFQQIFKSKTLCLNTAICYPHLHHVFLIFLMFPLLHQFLFTLLFFIFVVVARSLEQINGLNVIEAFHLSFVLLIAEDFFVAFFIDNQNDACFLRLVFVSNDPLLDN